MERRLAPAGSLRGVVVQVAIALVCSRMSIIHVAPLQRVACSYVCAGFGVDCDAPFRSDSSSEESELSLPLSLARASVPGSFVCIFRVGASSSSVCSELDSSAACACVTTCFGAAFLGGTFALAVALDFAGSFALTDPFGRCTAIVVFGLGGVGSSVEESSSLPTNSWLSAPLAGTFDLGVGADVGFDFVLSLDLEPGRGTGVFFVSFMVRAGPCLLRVEVEAVATFLSADMGLLRACMSHTP